MTAANQELVERVTRLVVEALREHADPRRVLLGVSNRHVHLSLEDFRTLFGADAPTVKAHVVQHGEFAANEVVTLVGPKGMMDRVRVMGPCRSRSQVELSRTDCYALGIKAPVAQSGHLDDAAPITIIGPKGRVDLDHAAIIAARHVHLGPEDARRLGVKDQDLVSVRIEGDRAAVLDNVICRVKDNFTSEVHLDTDEANAVGVRSGDRVTILVDGIC
ncbi:phosphate propanoyltransferase [Aestuariimicrobium sp. p3-SID1156]|uniref:phosphate propanoyltransferase n=1 Tax=Aestuariimicrobium sp. p3-SID1156 TaxID=2916038 RepID=UPI00223AD733|nr:phosphate propanoyltransferase [Aestuariimicrobium sp. p3-SID1156]MCT1458346.1 phosphate propanoyltransferase [Aestuariimicrobium sp. p3-SID1156]